MRSVLGSKPSSELFVEFMGPDPGTVVENVPLMRASAVEMSCLSSDLLVGPRMAISLGIEFHHGVLDGAVEVFRSREGLMGEVMPLQVAPEDFDVVHLRGGFRQPLDPEPVGARREGGP